MLSKDKYHQFVRLKFRFVLEYHNSPLVFLITCKLSEEIDTGHYEIGHFHNFWTSMTLTLTLDRIIWHTAVTRESLIDVYLQNKFC